MGIQRLILTLFLAGILASTVGAMDLNAQLKRAHSGEAEYLNAKMAEALPATEGVSSSFPVKVNDNSDNAEPFWGADEDAASPDDPGAVDRSNRDAKLLDFDREPAAEVEHPDPDETLVRLLDPWLRLDLRYDSAPRDPASIADELADWTLYGRSSTALDCVRIYDNIARAEELAAASGHPADWWDGVLDYESEDWDSEVDGSVIMDLMPYSYPGEYMTRSWGASSGLFGLDSDWYDIGHIEPGPNVVWYGAPEPWVIHIRPPQVRVVTPSPYYANPYVFTLVEDENGNPRWTWVNIWPNAGTINNPYSGYGYASSGGFGMDFHIKTPWGYVSYRPRDAAPAVTTLPGGGVAISSGGGLRGILGGDWGHVGFRAGRDNRFGTFPRGTRTTCGGALVAYHPYYGYYDAPYHWYADSAHGVVPDLGVNDGPPFAWHEDDERLLLPRDVVRILHPKRSRKKAAPPTAPPHETPDTVTIVTADGGKITLPREFVAKRLNPDETKTENAFVPGTSPRPNYASMHPSPYRRDGKHAQVYRPTRRSSSTGVTTFHFSPPSSVRTPHSSRSPRFPSSASRSVPFTFTD